MLETQSRALKTPIMA